MDITTDEWCAKNDTPEVNGMTLTLRQLHALSMIFDWTRGAHIQWIDEKVTGDRVCEGIVRCIGDDRGNFLARHEDVRGAFVRITTSIGFEHFMPMWKAVKLIGDDCMMEKR